MKIELMVDGNTVAVVSSDNIDGTGVLGFTAEMYKQLHKAQVIQNVMARERLNESLSTGMTLIGAQTPKLDRTEALMKTDSVKAYTEIAASIPKLQGLHLSGTIILL